MSFDARKKDLLISEDWKFVRIGEIAGVNETTLGAGDSLDYIRYIDISSVSTDKIEEPKLMEFQDAPSRAKRVVKKGDIIISTVRPNLKQHFLCNFEIDNHIASTGFCVITPKNDLYRWYLYSFLTSDQFTNHLIRIADGAAYPAFSYKEIRDAVIPLPDDTSLQFIKDLASSIFKKNQLNQQTNKTLEAMAQAIFKSWFVDFDPVRAKMWAKAEGRDANRAAMAAISGVLLTQDWDEIEATLDQKLSRMSETQRKQLHQTAALFPDELVDSELGEVPRGWGVKTAEKVLMRLRAPKRVKKDEVKKTGKIIVLEQGEGIIMGFHNGEAGFEASTEDPYFIFGDHTCITHLVIEPFDIAPNVIPLQGAEFDSYWTYYAIRDLQSFQEYRRHWSELKVKELVTPNNDVDQVFANAIKPLIMQINKNRKQNLMLSQLRDTLLPKLISGEIAI